MWESEVICVNLWKYLCPKGALAWVGVWLSVLVFASLAQADDDPFTTSLFLDATVTAGSTSLEIKDKDLGSLTQLAVDGIEADINSSPAIRSRASFGEVQVEYFVAEAFDLVCYTNDGTDGVATTGLGAAPQAEQPPGVTANPNIRANLKVWTPNFGTGTQPPVPVDFGQNSSGAEVPDPNINENWSEEAVWAALPEKDSVDGASQARVIFSSSEPSEGDPNFNQVQSSPFPVYFALDLLGVKGQKYRGDMLFELVAR
jgi:hypothetical protein